MDNYYIKLIKILAHFQKDFIITNVKSKTTVMWWRKAKGSLKRDSQLP